MESPSAERKVDSFMVVIFINKRYRIQRWRGLVTGNKNVLPLNIEKFTPSVPSCPDLAPAYSTIHK